MKVASLVRGLGFVEVAALSVVFSAFLAFAGCGREPGPSGEADACAAGQAGCACREGPICDVGECLVGTCVECARGAVGCVCLDNGMCNAGAVCGADRVCQACVDGQEYCACKAGKVCDGDLVCRQNVCVADPCPAGSRGCPCKPGGACDGDLHCGDNQVCAECTSDIAGCPCDAAGQCKKDLVCDATNEKCRDPLTCVQVACAAHQICQAAAARRDSSCLERCEDGWRWSGGGKACDPLSCSPSSPLSIAEVCAASRRECATPAGGGAVCGACLTGFTDEGGALADCRAVKDCASLGCDSQSRRCVPESSHADALCGACNDGFVEEGGACFVASCDPGGPGSILGICQGAHRECEASVAPARCGPCASGFVEDAQGACRQAHSCSAQDLDCAGRLRSCEGTPPFESCGACVSGARVDPKDPTRCTPSPACADNPCSDPTPFCIDDGGGTFHCEAPKCGPGQAWSDYPSPPGCVPCTLTCGDNPESKTGRIWPYTLQGSTECLCETKPGYYWENAGKTTYACDRDRDGWVRKEGRDKVRSADQALRQNARCSLRTIDRFVLENEYRQRLSVFLCNGAPYSSTDASGCPSGRSALDLYETARNDDQSLLDTASDRDTLTPPYQVGGVGRRLRAEEVNSLTRACISTTADYNDNKLSDIGEWHGNPKAPDADQRVFQNFGYYLELYRGYFEVRDSLLSGSLVIQERPRCAGRAGELPLGYGGGVGEYWRECTRSRDARYDSGGKAPQLGMEFAGWSCAAVSGTCPIPPPPTERVAQAGQAPPHGACQAPAPLVDSECAQAGGPWPCIGGAVWRGMSHHSQFKCVVVSAEPSATQPNLAANEINNGGYVMNACKVACPPGDPSCAMDCSGPRCSVSSVSPASSPGSNEPVLSCAAQNTASQDQVGFAAVAFAGGTSYERGCINEWQPVASSAPDEDPLVRPWRSLCPGWANNPASVLGQGNQLDFGQLQCGCGNNYGGLHCELGCPGEFSPTSTNSAVAATVATIDLVHVSPDYSTSPRTGFWLCGDLAAAVSVDEKLDYFKGHEGGGGTVILRGEIALSATDGTPMCQDLDDCSRGFAIK